MPYYAYVSCTMAPKLPIKCLIDPKLPRNLPFVLIKGLVYPRKSNSYIYTLNDWNLRSLFQHLITLKIIFKNKLVPMGCSIILFQHDMCHGLTKVVKMWSIRTLLLGVIVLEWTKILSLWIRHKLVWLMYRNETRCCTWCSTRCWTRCYYCKCRIVLAPVR